MMPRKSAIRSASLGLTKPRSSTAPSAIVSRAARVSGLPANRSAVKRPHSLRVVEDHAKGMAMAGAYPAHAMAQVDAVESTRALHRPVMHGKGHRVALRERQHFGQRLHPRPLLGQDEFAAGKVLARFREQDRALQRKYVFAI